MRAEAGGWVVYTVDVKATGTHTIEIPAASENEGGIFHLEFNGSDRTSLIKVPATEPPSILCGRTYI